MTNQALTNLVPVPRFTRTDSDDASEVLTVVKLTSGKLFASQDLDGREYPYLVQITTGPDVGDDFVGLYDLDGDKVDVGNADWVTVAEAPAEVIEQIESGWESGSNVVERI
jgi:hypothetical protein